MTYRTKDNQVVRVERPSPEAIGWEWQSQLTAYQQIRRMLARGERGAGSVLALRDVLGSHRGAA